MASGLNYKQVVVAFGERRFQEWMKGAELSALGRGPCGNKGEDRWSSPFREEGGRLLERAQRAGQGWIRETVFKWGRKRSSR